MANRLGHAAAALLGVVLVESRLAWCRLAQLEAAKRQVGRRRGKRRQLRREHQEQPFAVGGRVAGRRLDPPAAAPGKARLDPQAPEAAPAAERVREQAVDQELERPVELAGRGGVV